MREGAGRDQMRKLACLRFQLTVCQRRASAAAAGPLARNKQSRTWAPGIGAMLSVEFGHLQVRFQQLQKLLEQTGLHTDVAQWEGMAAQPTRC